MQIGYFSEPGADLIPVAAEPDVQQHDLAWHLIAQGRRLIYAGHFHHQAIGFVRIECDGRMEQKTSAGYIHDLQWNGITVIQFYGGTPSDIGSGVFSKLYHAANFFLTMREMALSMIYFLKRNINTI